MKKLLLILLCLPFIGFGQKNIDVKSESSIIKYLDSIDSDEIEGIWYLNTEYLDFKIGIIKDKYLYKGYIIDLSNDSLNGEILFNFTKSYEDSVYILETLKRVEKGRAYINSGFTKDLKLISTGYLSNLSEWKPVTLRKVYPSIESIIEKKMSKQYSDSLKIEDLNKIISEQTIDFDKLKNRIQSIEMKYNIVMNDKIKESAKKLIIESLETNLFTIEDLKEMFSKYSEKEIKLKDVKENIEQLKQ